MRKDEAIIAKCKASKRELGIGGDLGEEVRIYPEGGKDKLKCA